MEGFGEHKRGISTSSALIIGGAVAVICIVIFMVASNYYHDLFSQQLTSESVNPPLNETKSPEIANNNLNNGSKEPVTKGKIVSNQTQEQVLGAERVVDSKMALLSKDMIIVNSYVENQDYDSASLAIKNTANLTLDITHSQQTIIDNYQNLIDSDAQGNMSIALHNELLSADYDNRLFQGLNKTNTKLIALLSAQKHLYLLHLGTAAAPSSEVHDWQMQLNDTRKSVDTLFSLLNNSKTAQTQSTPNNSTTSMRLELVRDAVLVKTERLLNVTRNIVNTLNYQTVQASARQSELNVLRNYTLTRINEDRKLFDLHPVKLSSNLAAQIHAENVLRTGKISHWMTTGEKPYMVYTRYGGVGFVSQNIAVGGYSQYRQCFSERLNNECKTFDPSKSIDALEHDMMYDDLKCCDNGHRINILNQFHTDVSIGIAYNDYFLVLVENFENLYINSSRPLVVDNNQVTLAGQLDHLKLLSVTVQLDPTPSPSVYELNRDKESYDMGQVIGTVYSSDDLKYRNQSSTFKVIKPKIWSFNGDVFEIQFDISTLKEDLSKEGKDYGLFTIMLWVYGKDGETTEFPVTSYSINQK